VCVCVCCASDAGNGQALKNNIALRKLDFDNTQLGDQGVATCKCLER
jgi:hypothetical protein